MLDVFFTVDVEIWCDGWQDIDRKFQGAFKKYIYGSTPAGDFGIPYKLKVLNEHGLQGVFFVEPLFSARFGKEPLAEIVGMLDAGGQEVQLHLHTEWVDEARKPLLEDVSGKRQHLRYFSTADQTALIEIGLEMLEEAGAVNTNAFRAGSFAFNRDTLRALAANGVSFDSSYNATMFGLDSGVMPGVTVVEPVECEGVREYPMSVFRDGRGLRHAQLTACSYGEMEHLLWQAVEADRKSFVILSHSSELLNANMDRADNMVTGRFRKLCAFLDKNRDVFRVRGFKGLEPKLAKQQPEPLTSPIWRTGGRMLEQAYRMVYR